MVLGVAVAVSVSAPLIMEALVGWLVGVAFPLKLMVVAAAAAAVAGGVASSSIFTFGGTGGGWARFTTSSLSAS